MRWRVKSDFEVFVDRVLERSARSDACGECVSSSRAFAVWPTKVISVARFVRAAVCSVTRSAIRFDLERCLDCTSLRLAWRRQPERRKLLAADPRTQFDVSSSTDEGEA